MMPIQSADFGAALRAPSPLASIGPLDLCRDVGLVLGLENPADLETGVWIEGERLCLLYDDDLDDCVHIFIDVGVAPSPAEGRDMVRALMEINMELSSRNGESFGIDSKTDRIMFRAAIPEHDNMPLTVARKIGLYVSLIQELRADVLAGCARAGGQAY